MPRRGKIKTRLPFYKTIELRKKYMGYFDGLGSGSFRKDDEGNTVFYPWGVLSKGRILPDQVVEDEVRAVVRQYQKISLPLVLGVGLILGWIWAFLLLPILLAWFHLRTRKLIAVYPYSEDKLRLKESVEHTAISHGKFNLSLLCCGSVLLSLAGLVVVLSATSFHQAVPGWLALIFFGLCSAIFGVMLMIRKP